jgi:hypothetical protein
MGSTIMGLAGMSIIELGLIIGETILKGVYMLLKTVRLLKLCCKDVNGKGEGCVVVCCC